MAETAKGRLPPWVWWIGGGITVGMLAFYAGLAWRAEHMNWWGALGDAVAPFTSLITALALFAALASVSLQRKELELTRKEMRAQRREMAEQREQLERTARAQEALTDAQHKAAEEQQTANKFALMAQRATHMATVVACDAAIMRAIVEGPRDTKFLQGNLDASRKRFEASRDLAVLELDRLAKRLQAEERADGQP